SIPAIGPAIVLGILGWTFLIGPVRRTALEQWSSRHAFMLRSMGYGKGRILATYVVPELAWRLSPQAAALGAVYVGAFGAVEFLGLGARRQSSLGYLVLDSLDHVQRFPHYFLASVTASLVAVFIL